MLAAALPALAADLVVHWAAGWLSVETRSEPLSTVLHEITRQTALVMVGHTRMNITCATCSGG